MNTRSLLAKTTKSEVVIALATVGMLVVTAVIAFVYTSQLSVMKESLTALHESNRVGQMTILQLCVDSACTSYNVQITVADDGSQKWHLPLHVRNISDYPAFGLSYYHELSSTDSIPVPDESKFQRRHEGSVILPGRTLNCGRDDILAQEIVDSLQTGKSLFRHFFAKYSDAFGNSYMFYAVFTVPDPLGDIVQTVGLVRYKAVPLNTVSRPEQKRGNIMSPFEWIMSILTVLTLVGVFVYVYKTTEIANETKRQSDIVNRPAISVKVCPNINDFTDSTNPPYAHIATLIENHTTVHANLKIRIEIRYKPAGATDYEVYPIPGSYGGEVWGFAAKGIFNGNFTIDELMTRKISDKDEIIMDVAVKSAQFGTDNYLGNPPNQYIWNASKKKWIPYPVPR